MIVMTKIFVAAFTILLIAVLSSQISQYVIPSNVQNSQSSASDSAQIVPTPTPTPTPLPIPAHSGRQVEIPILTYHYIGNNPNPEDKRRESLQVTPDKFEEQMKYLSENGYHTIDFDRLFAVLSGQAILEPKSIILTFDDGYIDFYVNAYPILSQYNLHAVSFIPTGLIGGSYYMNWDQIREINLSGLVSFQSHSVNHSDLISLNDTQLAYQLSESRKVLEEKLGKIVNTFCYPYGRSDERVWQAVRQAGYIGAVGTWVSSTISEGVILDMPRIKISGTYNLGEFISRL
jgi:peptidoglycan/xylan/chitin deacetylase (PgdA/CDA1 family)